MKILHIIDTADPPLLRRIQARDALLLHTIHEVETWSLSPGRIAGPNRDIRQDQFAAAVRESHTDLCHFYTTRLPKASLLRRLPVPWIAPTGASSGLFFLRILAEPSRRVAPHPGLDAPQVLPDAVERHYFDLVHSGDDGRSVGAIVTETTRGQYDSVRARIVRLRDDVRWEVFGDLPTPEDLERVSVWIDLGVDPLREESGIPEALVAGRGVIAPRSIVNRSRLLEGDAGFLVPPNDPNELAHVLLTALFKPEIASKRIEVALANRDRFRPEHRLNAMTRLYASVIEDLSR